LIARAFEKSSPSEQYCLNEVRIVRRRAMSLRDPSKFA
jgi:hypothetical protein